MKLVIVESPAKAKTIARYLGRDYRVRATVGHIRDLPSGELGVDTDDTFRPKYATLPKKRSVISKLRREAERCEEVLIATDPDREGEIIAHHLAQSLRRVNKRVARVTFREITRPALQAAVDRPRPVDTKLVAAQQARRVMDRLVGYKVSPFLWRWMTDRSGLSAGRVQSAALRLVCEREQAIADFVPEPYWSLKAVFETPDGDRFETLLHKLNGKTVGSPAKKGTQHVIRDEAEARTLRAEAERRSYRVGDVQQKTIRRAPPPPFTTSTLQQAASTRLRLSPKATMRVAQQLYEGIELADDERVGLITYMRTDAVRLAAEAVTAIRDLVGEHFGSDYLPTRPHSHGKKQAAHAQDAHEAIRPTDIRRTPKTVRPHLTPEQYRLYRLIWERTVASQMAAAVIDRTTVDVASEDGVFVFRAVGSVVRFPDFLALLKPDPPDAASGGKKGQKGKDDDTPPDQDLPDSLRLGLPVDLVELTPGRHSTKPPPRYTEASLVKALEEQGIGRPSTYSGIVQTLVRREYAELKKRQFYATDLGLRVNRMLVQNFPSLFDLKFTARMEDRLDQIADGSLNYKRTLQAFYHDQLMRALDQAHHRQRVDRSGAPPSPASASPSGRPATGAAGPSGRRAASPASPPAQGQAPAAKPKRAAPVGEACPACGKPLLERTGKFGPFLSCSGFPACRYTRSAGTPAPDSAQALQAPTCPVCNHPMVLRKGPKGRFYGCSTFPTCRKTLPYGG